jgi:hypothetical protein
MESSRFQVEVERIGPEQALAFWTGATRTTVFTHPEVLARTSREVRWWLATESGEPAWVWPVCVHADGRVAPPELCYYVGPFRVSHPDRSPRRRLMRDVAVQQALLNALSREYGRLAWSTMPGEHELRPWLWYGGEGRHPVAYPRYTAVLDALGSATTEDLLRRFASDRRSDIRLAAGKQPVLLPPARMGRIKELYRDTLAATGAAEVADRRLAEVEALAKLAEDGHGRVMTFGMGEDGIERAVWIVLFAKGRACEVLGASDHAWRDSRLNAYGRLHCILAAQAMGADRYDFTGANSPQRGSDKHSYGAEPELFFDLTLGSSGGDHYHLGHSGTGTLPTPTRT